MIENEGNDREEDLFCIFNTIALFLEHQNFRKTCEVFKEECGSRNLNKTRISHQGSALVGNDLEEKQEVYNFQKEVVSLSKPLDFRKSLLKEDRNSAQVTYSFQDGECVRETDSVSSCGSTIGVLKEIRSRVSLADYHHLKEKFVDLRNKHKSLMDELDQKTRYLDRIIPLLEQENFIEYEQAEIDFLEHPTTPNHEGNISSKYCQSECKKTVPTVDKKLLEDELAFQHCSTQVWNTENEPGFLDNVSNDVNGSTHVYSRNQQTALLPNSNKIVPTSSTTKSTSSSARSNSRIAQTESVDTLAATISNSNLTRSSEYSLLGLCTTEIVPKDPADEVNFLFGRTKGQQIHSAPNGSLDNHHKELNGDHRRTKMCFSMPLSPRKHLSNSQYFTLEYPALKRDLAYGQLDKRLLILQALRWRLTRCSSVERGYIINSYVSNDLLDLNTENSIVDIFADNNIAENLAEATARLTNVIASLKQGRDYLCSSKRLVKANLVPRVRKSLDKFEGIPGSVEMLIVTLQKLSIRKEQRKIMIQEGLLQSISNLLSSGRNKLSTYCLEYSCALFMNLCLEDEAKVRCAKDPAPIMKVFSCLLDGVQPLYMPYISGALYSILSEEALRDEALRQQIDVMIFQQMKNTKDKYLRKQLEFIIRSRFRGEGANFTCSENEPLEEVDLLEPELDQNDTVIGRLQGEILLEMYKMRDETACGLHTLPNSIDASAETLDICPMNTIQNSSIGTKTGGTTTDSPKKNAASKIKFDAEVSTGTMKETPLNAVSDKSSVEYIRNYRANIIPEAIESCNCLGPAKYNCGCYEAIKQSVEEEDESSEYLPTGIQAYISLMNGKSNPGKACMFSTSGSSNSKVEKGPPAVSRSTYFDHICDLWRRGIIDCICYREVFLSRPKLNRTPPLSPKINDSQP